MAVYTSNKATKFLQQNYSLTNFYSLKCRKIYTLDKTIFVKASSLKYDNHFKPFGSVLIYHHKNYSQKIPKSRPEVIPSIFSYFTRAQREARERRTDGITSIANTPVHNVYSLINSTTPAGFTGSRKNPLRQMFYCAQIANFSIVSGATVAGISALTGNFNITIPWSENITLDHIGIGMLAALTPIILGSLWLLLLRIPIRIYYDEHNGIYTAAFCRLFIPFKTITFSFPAHSAEVLEPNAFFKACGLLDTPTIKIRPIQKDVYIHHLECLSAEMGNKTENSEIKNKDYFPPAAASATAAINADESISQKRESRESYKISKTGKPKKVGYMPPAYTAAVSAIAAEKEAEGRLLSWAVADKTCYMPISFFTTPSFYYRMLKSTSELD